MHDLIVINEEKTLGTSLYLDGSKLEGVTEFTINQTINGPIRLTLEMCVGSVNQGGDILKLLLDSGSIGK